ncbi:MAG: hypothetical protein ABIK09_12265 [Pseudomonadota bacterium]
MGWRFGCLVAALVLLSACEFTEFELDMEVEGGALVRRLVTRRVDVDHSERVLRPYPAELLQRIAGAYGVEIPDPIPGELRFEARFEGATPNDIGGSGYLSVQGAPMGRLVAYSEQFRGEGEPGPMMERAFEATDQWVDLHLGWLQGELGELGGWDRIRDLIDGALRRDLKNLVAIFHMTIGLDSRLNAPKDPAPGGDEEFLLRGLHLLVGRGYLTDSEVPRLLRAMNQSGERSLRTGREVLRGAVARTAQLDGEEAGLTRLVALLMGDDAVKTSLARHVETTDLWKVRLAAWEEGRRTQPSLVRPDPSSISDALLSDMIGSNLIMGSEDRLTAHLRCPVRPHRTNARWDAASGTLEWTGSPAHKGQVPSLAYAFWTEPAAAFQTERFGRVVLTGEALETYVLWYRGLAPDQRAGWDALVAGLRPGAGAIDRLRAHRFEAGDEAQVENEQTRIEAPRTEKGRDVLAEALEAPAPAETP